MHERKRQQISVHCILSCLYFLLLPTTIAVNSAGNSILKLATIPIGLYFLITLFFSNRILQINCVHLALVLYTLLIVVTLFFDADKNSVDTVIGYLLNAALYICLTVIPYNKHELELMENIQILLLIVLNALTLLSNGAEDGRTTLMIMGQTSDPNYFVGFFIFPLTVTLKQLVSGKHPLLSLLLIAVSMYSVFLSGSRGGFFAVVATIAGFTLIYPSGVAKRVWFLIKCFVLLAVLWMILKPILPEKIVERMTIESVLESGGTGRIVIWKSMIQEIIDQPEKLLFGRGTQSLHRLFANGRWNAVVAHNHLIQSVYNLGLVGLISFLLLTGISFFRCCRKRKCVSIAIIGMMALSLSLSFNQTTRTFWNLIAYAAFAFPNDDILFPNNGGSRDNE